ncbi:MAG: AAA family ATPase [Odoribacter sp.]
MDEKVVKSSEKTQAKNVKGMVRSVRVSGRKESDYRGEKEYRTVYGVEECNHLYIDTEIYNKQWGEKAWKATVTIRVFRLENKKGICVAEKSGKIEVGENDGLFTYEERISREDFSDGGWKEGVYRILTDVDGVAGESEDLYLIQGDGCPEKYFRVLHTGIDRCEEETEEEMQARQHSFRELDVKDLKNVRFFLMAQNLCNEEWVYEFSVRVLNVNGTTQALQVVKSMQYVKDQAGNSILCLAVNLGGEEEGFSMPGVYSVVASCFGKVILTFQFTISHQNIPYDFGLEIQNTGKQEQVQLSVESHHTVKDKEEILDRLYRLVALRKVKEEITQICDYAEFIQLRRENGFGDHFPAMHLLFTGNAGTGKSTVAEMLGELYQQMGVLENGKVNHYGRQELVRDGVAAEEKLVRQALKNSAGGILFVDQVGDLFHPEDPNDRGVVALSILFSVLTRETPEVLVILADEVQEMNMLIDALPDLKKIFSRHLYFEDYSPEELMEITRCKLEKLQFRFTPSAEEKFYKQLTVVSREKDAHFMNGHYIDEQLESVAMRMSGRLMANRNGKYKKEDLMLMVDEDIVALQESNPEKSLEKLKAMVGLGQLKQSILQHLNYVYFIKERQKLGFTDVMPPLNMIFSGNPGTGKMSVAKMMGEIYHSVGVLARPNIVIQDARILNGEGGLTPQQGVAALMDAALGGILYLEYADVLPQSEYGLALFEALLSELSMEECGETVVILGGFPDRIEKMLETNPTLKNYFLYTFHFNDYAPDELMEIAVNKLKEKNYVFHPKAKEVFKELIHKAYENRDKTFGNALLMEKIVEMSIRNMSERTMNIRKERELTRQEMTTIRKEDIPVHIFELPKFERDVFDEEAIQEALSELDHLVGQMGMKKQIRDFVELARHYSRNGIKLSTRMSLQWCFTGNSAMGKGTVARLIARLYKAMGIINTGKVLNFKVEKMIGLMEEEAQRSIGEALLHSNGGILLFDEDSPRLNEAVGLRERVRAILMNQMAERPGSYIIIYAEPKPALATLNSDVEHLSELVNILEFQDYTKEELMVILKRRLEKEQMKLTATARQYMTTFIDSLVSTEERTHASSRLMRIVADLIVRNCLQRIAKEEKRESVMEVISVQKQDVVMFTEQFVAGLVNERRRIGFI